MTVQKYSKKPIVVEALQLRWDTWSEICNFVGVDKLEDGKPQGTFIDSNGDPVDRQSGHSDEPSHFIEGDTLGLLIPTMEGVMLAREGDYIIKGIKGEFYPCKPDIFEETYILLQDSVYQNTISTIL